MKTDEEIVEVIAKAVRWFDFDEPGDTATSLARVILAQLRGKGLDVVEYWLPGSADVCVIHLAPRATGEDWRVCWEYDGGEDCRFTSSRHPADTEHPTAKWCDVHNRQVGPSSRCGTLMNCNIVEGMTEQ